MSSAAGQRPVRKDALRNRGLVLDAARRVFSARGLDASLEEVAAEAGVGVGTAHRAFGSKDALIAALYDRIVDDSVALVLACSQEPSGWSALRRVLWELTELQTEDRALHSLLYRTEYPVARQLRERIEPLLTAIIQRARTEGAVRDDFAATDIPIITRAISSVSVGTTQEAGKRIARRQVELFLRGIGPIQHDDPIPPPLHDDEFAGWLKHLPAN